MLTSALEHYRRQQRITAAALLDARRRRRRGPAAVAEALIAYQLLAARDAIASVDEMLQEQRIDAPLDGEVVATSVVGTASDGRPLIGLFEQATSEAAFGLMVATQIQDAARGAAGISIAARPRIGYVRMLNPPSCSRCAILAGRFYRFNEGFTRHPRCDCRHIPASEATSRDLTTNPHAYFESLSEAEQDRIFTKAGARAIRDGADMNQVVNARRGMAKAQVGGRKVLVTTEGTTARGVAGARLGDLRKSGERYRRSGRPRVMPETIYEVAEDREDAIRLLRANGFIL